VWGFLEFGVFSSIFRIQFRQSQLHRPTFAELSGEPVFHIDSQCFQVNPETGFQSAIADGERFVKAGAASEAPHTEAVQPGEWARPRAGRIEHFDLDFASEHLQSSEGLAVSYQRDIGLLRAEC